MATMTLSALSVNRIPDVDKSRLDSIHGRIAAGFADLRRQVVKEPDGFIKYPYLIPAGFYSQLWDWDAFFMANHFISLGYDFRPGNR